MDRSIQIENGVVSDSLVLYADLSDKEMKYSFRLVSPGGELVWDGRLEYQNGIYSSDTLQITEGAVMPKGDYQLYIHSDKGGTFSQTLWVADVEKPFLTYGDEFGPGVNVLYMNELNVPVSKEDASLVQFSYHDRYNNVITARESL